MKSPGHRRVLNRRTFLRVSAGSAAGVGLYTWGIEPHWLEIVERPMPVAHLPEQLRGARVAQLSDLHIGPQVADDYLIDVFDRVRALAPEIVVYTGDFTSYYSDIASHVERMFPHLPLGTRATFGVLGNHDYGPAWARTDIADRITELAELSGIRILRNKVTDVDGLQVVGLDDLWAGRFRPEAPLASLDPAKASLVLSHNPDTVDRPGWGAYAGWILAGHTHGGQCKAPFLPPPLLPVKNRRYTSGRFALAGGRHMYINRGVGHLMKVRFNARPEVTVFRLAKEDSAVRTAGSSN